LTKGRGEVAQAGNTDTALDNELYKPIRDAVELPVIPIGQAERGNIACECSQRPQSMVGKIARIQVALHELHAVWAGCWRQIQAGFPRRNSER